MTSTEPVHYVESDVPDGMTLSSWRRAKARAEVSGRRAGLLRRRGRWR
jgi:hypothetical protein